MLLRSSVFTPAHAVPECVRSARLQHVQQVARSSRPGRWRFFSGTLLPHLLGAVVGFKITNPGSNYTSAPTVLVASPPFTPEVSVAVSKVSVSMKVVLGKTYQIQSSSDSSNWTAVGPPFVADSESISQEFAVAETGRFFRVVEVQ